MDRNPQSGHNFHHPSGANHPLFIQTRDLARSEAELIFAARCLVLAVSGVEMRDANTVLIDTMGIYALVREAFSFYGSPALITSFHSYEALEELILPDGPLFVVISASTSGGMARKFEAMRTRGSKHIITLVDLVDSNRPGPVVLALSERDPSLKLVRTTATDVPIEIGGEHFSAKARPPRPVLLAKAHRPKALATVLKNFAMNGFRPLNTVAGAHASKKLISLDTNAIANALPVETWLKEELRWSAPAATNWIITTDDVGSTALAVIAATEIHALRNSLAPPAVVVFTPGQALQIPGCTGVVVITALAGDGGVLREISRDLREALSPDVPRLFLAAVGLPQSTAAWNRLRQFLVQGKDRNYSFSEWTVLALGDAESSDSWDKAGTALSFGGALAGHGLDDTTIDRSVELFDSALNAASNGFLARNSGAELSLTGGFLFLGDALDEEEDFEPSNLNPAVVHLCMLSALQCARETGSPTENLRSTGYESVVLAPECFARFNDHILQASLLRAARPSELNYSRIPELSGLMKEFLLKVFRRSSTQFGGASLEFAYALLTGRLSLRPEDIKDVVVASIGHLQSEGPSALLGCLIILRANLERAQ